MYKHFIKTESEVVRKLNGYKKAATRDISAANSAADFPHSARLTARQAAKPIAEAKKIALAKSRAYYDKNITATRDNFERISTAPELIGIDIAVEWRKSSVWGYCPHVTAVIRDTDGWTRCEGYASGCGYDKESAAIAKALNQSPAVLKVLAAVYEKALRANSRPLYSLVAWTDGVRLDGGVGVGCYRAIFEAAGYIFDTVGAGRSFAVYRITKKTK